MKLITKKTIGAFLLTSLLTGTIQAQTTATDFNVSDCDGINHHLFSELDEGKIVVIAWVMPCGSCAPPAIAAYNAVQSYATSHPDKVIFYLSDDYGNSACNTLNGWAAANQLGDATKFSDAAIAMSDYGTNGMPKIVVMGGSAHKVEYNKNFGVTEQEVNDAIASLITETASQNITEVKINPVQLSISPNPSIEKVTANYTLTQEDAVEIQIMTLDGSIVYSEKLPLQAAGEYTFECNNSIQLMNGNYFFKLKTSLGEKTIQFHYSK